MIFEIYDGVNDNPETQYTVTEQKLEKQLLDWLIPFPIHRVRVRKNYSIHKNEISLDIELDSTLTSEKIYNQIVYRIFKTLEIDLITLQNNSKSSNFTYFFYGEKNILEYNCSIFIDVPKKAYSRGEAKKN